MSSASNSIIVPDVATAKAALSPDYNPNIPIQVNGDAAPQDPRIRNPILNIFAMNEYVVFQLERPTKRYPSGRQAVHYKEAIKRLKSIKRRHTFEDGGKPDDETQYERWMVEWTIKAVAQCATNAGNPFKSTAVTAMLKALDVRMARIKNNL